jgi:hypothetical protein
MGTGLNIQVALHFTERQPIVQCLRTINLFLKLQLVNNIKIADSIIA